MQQENTSPTELWRWKMIKKVAEYINQPDDINMSELKTMIESYRSHCDIKRYLRNDFNQL